MGVKIKWNDDRVSGALTAILLIGRERLHRGETDELVASSLAEYRSDPAGYKIRKIAWADPREPGPLSNPKHVAYYQNLLAATDALRRRMEQNKRQSNSLLELDNYLVASLDRVR